MNRVTIEAICNMSICYSPERVRRLAGDAKDCSAMDVLAKKCIPLEDRLFLVLRAEFIPAPMLHEFACRCAERALSRTKTTDPRSIDAIATKRAWLRGEATNAQLARARAAARAAEVDAWAAVEAAEGPPRANRGAAARAAARAAVRDEMTALWAAKNASCKWQVNELVKMLQEAE